MRRINFEIYTQENTKTLRCSVHFERDGREVMFSDHLCPNRHRIDSRALYSADPILEKTAEAFNQILKGAYNRNQYYRIAKLKSGQIDTKYLQSDELFFVITFTSKYDEFNTALVNDLPKDSSEVEVVISKKGSSYSINGMATPRKHIAPILARILLDVDAKTKRKEVPLSRRELRDIVTSSILVPEDIRYVLSTRLPFQYMKEGRTINVRLQVMQISDDDYAIEISSNVWGKISQKDLMTMIGFYRHGKRVGNWKFLSPRTLFTRLMNKEPTEAETKLMMAFLEQNRSEKLVQERAMTLLDDLLVQYPDRVKRNDSKETIRIIVSGQSSDWLLCGSKSNLKREKIGVQAVSTQMLRIRNDNVTGLIMHWGHSICINSGGKNPSLGDQFASRILSLLNDSMTMSRVSTLGSEVSASKPRLVMSSKIFTRTKIDVKNPFSNKFELVCNEGEKNEMLRMPIIEE